MVTIPWITKILKRHKSVLQDTSILYELDKSKEGIHKLEELTDQLEKLEFEKHRSDEFLKSIANNLDIPIWAKDTECRFLFLNNACAKIILRTTVDKAMHLTDKDFEHDALAQVCIESDRKVMATTSVKRFIEHAQYPDYDLWLDVVKSPLFVKGELVGVTGMGKDITSLVSTKVKNDFAEACFIELDLDLEYCPSGAGRRSNDLLTLLENNKREKGG